MLLKTLTLTLGLAAATSGLAAPKGKVLVVLSSEDKITVLHDRQGGGTSEHPTGFFLSELMTTAMRLQDDGYELVFASPKGTKPVMDRVSDAALWFGGDEAKYREARERCEALGVCGDGLVGTRTTRTLRSVLAAGLGSYKGVFLPGGHAPMEDLLVDPELGKILRYFHDQGKPTALICHAPIALLSTLDDAPGFVAALARGDETGIQRLSAGWIYKGYAMTAFSTKEERQEEAGGSDGVLGGFVRFYPDEALDQAGGRVTVRARKWQSQVVQDRELITGENPFSDTRLADLLLAALNTPRR